MVTLVGQTWMQLSPSKVHAFSLKGSAFACSWYDSTLSNSIYAWYRMSMYVCVCMGWGVEVTQMKKGRGSDLAELNLCNIWSNIYIIYIYIYIYIIYVCQKQLLEWWLFLYITTPFLYNIVTFCPTHTLFAEIRLPHWSTSGNNKL